MYLDVCPIDGEGVTADLLNAAKDGAVDAGIDVNHVSPEAVRSAIRSLPETVNESIDSEALGLNTDHPEGTVILRANGEPIFAWNTRYYLEPFYGIGIKDVINILSLLPPAIILKKFISSAWDRIQEVLRNAKQLVLTSYGTIHSNQFKDNISDSFNNWISREQRELIVMTGWGGSRKVEDILSQVNLPWGVVTEGGSVVHRRSNDFDPEPLFVDWINGEPKTEHAHPDLYEHPRLVTARKAWSSVARTAVDEIEKPVFYSQNNDYGCGVYIDPPRKVVESFSTSTADTPDTVIQLRSRLLNERRLPNDGGFRTVKGHDKRGIVDNTPDGWYVLEKINALERPLRPFRIMDISRESVTFEILEADSGKESISAGDISEPAPKIESIASEARKLFQEDRGIRTETRDHYQDDDGEGESARRIIVPQTNSIDVFVQSKKEAYLNKLQDIFDVNTDVAFLEYIYRGSISDKDLIGQLRKIHKKTGPKVEVHGTEDLPDHSLSAVDESHDVDNIGEILPKFKDKSLII